MKPPNEASPAIPHCLGRRPEKRLPANDKCVKLGHLLSTAQAAGATVRILELQQE